MLICSISMACVMLLFLATNTLITKDMLHEVALFGRGKLAFHVQKKQISGETHAEVPPKPLASATASSNKNADPQADASERRRDHLFASKCKNTPLEYGLTPRALEVLIIWPKELLAARSGRKWDIPKERPSPIGNIYRKLDVHSKQESSISLRARSDNGLVGGWCLFSRITAHSQALFAQPFELSMTRHGTRACRSD